MSGFFDRLAGRARGDAPSLQPLPRPLFAPERVEAADEPQLEPALAPAPPIAAATASDDEGTTRVPHGREPAASPAPLLPLLPRVRERDEAPRAPSASVAPTTCASADSATVAATAPPLLMPTRAPFAPAPARARPDDAALATRNDAAPDLAPAAATLRATAARSGSERALRPASMARTQPPPAPAPTRTLEPPVVHVTIGRIEVRATTPPPPAPRRAPAPERRPSLNLEQYLAERYRGER